MNDSDYFDFPLNSQQSAAFERIIAFVQNPTSKIFILKGHAGTGKTLLIKGLAKYLENNDLKYSLLASTGRASKILTNTTGIPSNTIHSNIYTFNELDEDLQKISELQDDFAVDDKGQVKLLFGLKPSLSNSVRVYVVDESSMISDSAEGNNSFALFGSGRLLKDLLAFDQYGKFIFVGDPCQLPPINQTISPALDTSYFCSQLGVEAEEYELTTIVRQSPENGIVSAALRLRQLYYKNPKVKWAKLPVKGYDDIVLCSSHLELIHNYSNILSKENFDEGVLICQTNRKCLEINKALKVALKKEPNKLEVGDLLMVTQNNFTTGLVNGDQVLVKSIGSKEYRCGLSFLKIKVEELSSGAQYSLVLIEDILFSNRTNLPENDHKKLLIDFYLRMKDLGIKQDSESFKQHMYTDPYLNALKAVFGFAITCHKSQGGEWDNVYLYLDNKVHGIPKPGIYQWWYTATTRAKSKLILINDWFLN
ncbi:ATP-dependent DNA helicase [Robiginitalea sediminis]|uniref:ATP-dependent DNA helicase n=1 Tax=Robiginitalea sediminis TaxID=1982593 RepID=UPI001303422D|nr:AAA family ATPase [Robiginitalea sediminis]